LSNKFDCTVTRSGEPYRSIEGTALAVIVWSLTDPKSYSGNIDAGLDYLQRQCRFGCYGTSQANTLVLKAIVTSTQVAQNTLAKAGSPTIALYVDGQRLVDAAFNSRQSGALELQPFHQALSSGTHKIKIEVKNYDGTLPYSLGVAYNTLQPDTAPDCAVKLVAQLNSSNIKEGEGGEVRVCLENVTSEPLPMTMAIIGIPGGLEPRHEKLKELVKTETIDFYEIKGREVICYWRGMHEKGKVEFNIDVTARIPGIYKGPASRAYLYYSPDSKYWLEGLAVKIDSVDFKLTGTLTPTETAKPKVHSVADFLDSIKLGQYKKDFESQGWDDMQDVVDEVDDKELKDMGIEKKGHRKKLLRHFEEWEKGKCKEIDVN